MVAIEKFHCRWNPIGIVQSPQVLQVDIDILILSIICAFIISPRYCFVYICIRSKYVINEIFILYLIQYAIIEFLI